MHPNAINSKLAPLAVAYAVGHQPDELRHPLVSVGQRLWKLSLIAYMESLGVNRYRRGFNVLQPMWIKGLTLSRFGYRDPGHDNLTIQHNDTVIWP
jgi:hypothetical protein